MKYFAILLVFLLFMGLTATAQEQPQAEQQMQGVEPSANETMIDPSTGTPVPEEEAAQAAMPAPPQEDPMFEGFFEDIGYSPVDKRDPFLPYLSPAQRLTQAPDIPLEPLQRFALNQLKLVGIIWDVGTPKALIEDPSGKSHIIVENTKLGEHLGYVAAIREGEVIVVEQLIDQEGRKSFQTKVLKLTASAVKQ